LRRPTTWSRARTNDVEAQLRNSSAQVNFVVEEASGEFARARYVVAQTSKKLLPSNDVIAHLGGMADRADYYFPQTSSRLTPADDLATHLIDGAARVSYVVAETSEQLTPVDDLFAQTLNEGARVNNTVAHTNSFVAQVSDMVAHGIDPTLGWSWIGDAAPECSGFQFRGRDGLVLGGDSQHAGKRHAGVALRSGPGKPAPGSPHSDGYDAGAGHVRDSGGGSAPPVGTVPSSWWPEISGASVLPLADVGGSGRTVRYCGPPS
jgi:hypothetical protein